MTGRRKAPPAAPSQPADPIKATPGPVLLRESEVAALIGFATRTIRKWVSMGTFPRPVCLPGFDPQRRARRWLRVEVEAWIAKMANDRTRIG